MKCSNAASVSSPGGGRGRFAHWSMIRSSDHRRSRANQTPRRFAAKSPIDPARSFGDEFCSDAQQRNRVRASAALHPPPVNGAEAKLSKEATMMKCKSILAIVVVGSGLVLHAAQAQQPGVKRTELQRHDLGVPGREVVQVRVDLAPGVAFPPAPPSGRRDHLCHRRLVGISGGGQAAGDAQGR
jgi:hypothetical protein